MFIKVIWALSKSDCSFPLLGQGCLSLCGKRLRTCIWTRTNPPFRYLDVDEILTHIMTNGGDGVGVELIGVKWKQSRFKKPSISTKK